MANVSFYYSTAGNIPSSQNATPGGIYFSKNKGVYVCDESGNINVVAERNKGLTVNKVTSDDYYRLCLLGTTATYLEDYSSVQLSDMETSMDVYFNLTDKTMRVNNGTCLTTNNSKLSNVSVMDNVSTSATINSAIPDGLMLLVHNGGDFRSVSYITCPSDATTGSLNVYGTVAPIRSSTDSIVYATPMLTRTSTGQYKGPIYWYQLNSSTGMMGVVSTATSAVTKLFQLKTLLT